MLAHQKRAKYCIKLQKSGGNPTKTDMKECDDCGKYMSTPNYQRHIKSCSARKDVIIEEYIREISEKDKTIIKLTTEMAIYKKISESSTSCVEEIAKQPKINNIWVNVGSFSILSDENEQDKIGLLMKENFSDEHFNSGQKGLARWAHKHLLTDNNGNLLYKCTNSALDVFKYKNTDGDICKDIQAKKLSKLLGEKVKPLTKDKITRMGDTFGSDEWDICYENAQELNDIGENNSSFRKEIRCLTSQ